MNIDNELKELLRRTDPPEGFSDRVMRTARGGLKPTTARWRALAAAVLLVTILGGWTVHAAVRARNEVLTALSIASHKVADAQRAVNRRQ